MYVYFYVNIRYVRHMHEFDSAFFFLTFSRYNKFFNDAGYHKYVQELFSLHLAFNCILFSDCSTEGSLAFRC